MFDIFRRKPAPAPSPIPAVERRRPTPPAPTRIVAPALAQARVVEPKAASESYDPFALAHHRLRRGMWVMKDGFPRAGVLTALNGDGIATVMLTQEDGTNLLETNTLAGSLRQAYLEEIPAPRVTQSVAAMASMGYKRKPQ